jgi:two-component system LytT family response regulator
MSPSSDIALEHRPAGWRRRGVDLLLIAMVFAAYSVTLAIANDLDPLSAMAGGAANTVPVVVFGAAARRAIVDRLIGRPLPVQIVGHAALAAAYALLAYWLLVVLIGLKEGRSPLQFMVEPFSTRAMSWQLLENLTTYAVIALVTYLQARPAPAAAAPPQVVEVSPEPARAISRYFIRSGDDIHPIDVDAIISIAGADDYAEVATTSGRHLVRMTLAELEQSLDPARFLRVHRSRIVNVDRIARAEPAGGGRLLLHMEDGEAVTASRAGTRKLRDRLL